MSEDADWRHQTRLESTGICETGHWLAGVWIQLARGQTGHTGWVLRYGVEDLRRERERLAALGVAPGDVETVPGVISFFAFRDPDGNELSCYEVLDAT